MFFKGGAAAFMNTLITVLLLLVCLLLSNIVSHWLPSLPAALTQIVFGIIMAMSGITVRIQTEWFLLLFIAPLLYYEGRHFPREKLWKMKAPIFGNAIILVILTTLLGGLFINRIVPEIPLAAAFALAAILSPTDPVTVIGISKRIHVPGKVLSLVRGESLINDASGLIGFKYAIAAVMTGYFSLTSAILDFIYVFAVGTVSGFLLAFLVTMLRHTLHKKGVTDVTFYSLLSLITPFLIYFITEDLLHASGVMSVVAAGIFHSLAAERIGTYSAKERLLIDNSWSVLVFVLNGIVFILLGLNIPSSMIGTVADPNISNWLAVAYVIAIGIVILGIRFIWSLISSKYNHIRHRAEGAEKPGIKTSLLTSLLGARGAVTMAGVLSIPYLTANGAEFPNRSLIMFLASGTILFTLIAATIFLPKLSNNEKKEADSSNQKVLVATKRKLVMIAIKGFRQEMNKENKAVAYELIEEYKMMFTRIYSERDLKKGEAYLQDMTEVRLVGLKAERKYIQDLMEKNQLSEEDYNLFEKSLDHKEEALLNNVSADMKYLIGKILRNWRYPIGRNEEPKAKPKMGIGKYIQLKALHQAIESIKEYAKDRNIENSNIVQTVIFDYERTIEQLKATSYKYSEQKEEQREALRMKIIDMERAEINRMYESGEITHEQVKELRRFVNYTETIALYEYE